MSDAEKLKRMLEKQSLECAKEKAVLLERIAQLEDELERDNKRWGRAILLVEHINSVIVHFLDGQESSVAANGET